MSSLQGGTSRPLTEATSERNHEAECTASHKAIGPDSMKVDSKGNIYVAQWFGGKILKISPDGKLLHIFKIAAGDGTTNVAFGEGEKELYVTVVKDPKDAQARGSIVKILNVK